MIGFIDISGLILALCVAVQFDLKKNKWNLKKYIQLVFSHAYISLFFSTVDGSNISYVVTVSALRPESSIDHSKLLKVGLGVFALILLVVNIGLGVYCKLFLCK